MKKIVLALLFVLLYSNCPKKFKVDLEKIQIYDIGPIYADIIREKPRLAGLRDLEGTSITSCRTDPEFLQVLMGRIGLVDILNASGIDYVIGDMNALHHDSINYFIIPDRMGYAISNIGGIRFAIFYPGKKQLSISDNVEIALVRERSDILWLISEDEIGSGPRRVDFYIQNRGLADTSWSPFTTAPSDSAIMAMIDTFRRKLDAVLNYRISADNKPLDSYILERIAANEQVDVILYPQTVFASTKKYDSLTINELIRQIDCSLRFGSSPAAFTAGQIDSIAGVNDYVIWGKRKKTNNKTIMPEKAGRYLFDIIAPR